MPATNVLIASPFRAYALQPETQAKRKRVKDAKFHVGRVQSAASPQPPRRNEKRQGHPDQTAVEVFVREVPRLLLQLPRDRGDAARHRAPGEALLPALQDRGTAPDQGRRQRENPAAAPPEGPGIRLGVRPARPEDAPLHRVRRAPGGVPRLSRQHALRVLRFPEVRARPPGRPEVHCFDLSAFSRIADRVVVGVIASGSSLISISAGLPEAEARSKAPAKSSVRSTVSPCAPKARA